MRLERRSTSEEREEETHSCRHKEMQLVLPVEVLPLEVQSVDAGQGCC